MIFLSDDERAQLRAQHKRERDGRVRDRIKAVLLYDKGWSIAAIAEALLLSEDAIREHINEYRESKKLKPANGGSVEKFSIEQSEQLRQHLQRHTYLYVKDIIVYVQSTWSITIQFLVCAIGFNGIIFPIKNLHLCQERPMSNNSASGWRNTRS